MAIDELSSLWGGKRDFRYSGLADEELLKMTQKKRILVIDDDAIQRSLIVARLGKRDGHEVLAAANGASGIKLAMKKQPDLILLDWMMPEMDGMQVLEALQKQKKTAPIPVYMFTAKGMMRDVEIALAGGAEGYFTKPVDLDGLSSRIRSVLASAEA